MRVAPICLVAALAARADAAPLAELAADVDGDGAADRVELSADGTLAIQTRSGATTVKLGGAQLTRATIEAAQLKQGPALVIRASDEAIVVLRSGATWNVVARVPVGGVGLDRDEGVDLAVTPAGLVRYQTRPGYHRCDGRPALLFAEGLIVASGGTKFQRLARIPTDVPEAAPVIAARIDRDPAQPPLLYQARVASHEPGTASAGDLAIPTSLDDGKPDTVWSETFAASAGEGQFFTFERRMASVRAAQIRIIPGNPTARTAGRPRRLGVVTAHGAWHIDLPETDPAGTAYVADLPEPIDGCVTVVLETATGTGPTAIAELEVYGEGERAGGGEAALAHAIAEDSGNAKAAAQELARRGAAGVTALDGELAKTSDAQVRERLVRALLAIRDPAAGPPLVRAAAQGWVRDRDLIDVIAALGKLGQPQELRELAHRRALAIDARIAAVRALASSPDRAALIDLAGEGPRELRHAVIDALVEQPIATMIQAAQSPNARASGDLWRAVTRRAHAVAADRPAALAAMLAALPVATDYDRRYRLIDGIAALGDATALATLGALLHGLPADGQRAAFEQVAARAIATDPRPEALELVYELARAPDPGVRLAALDALATAEGGTAGAWHAADGPDAIDRVLESALASDTWPEVRRRAAQALGTRCARLGPAKALAASVARDPELTVRGDALAGMVDCKAAGVADVLAHLWDDGKAPIELRQRAIDLTAVLGDPALGARLVGKLATWRGGAISSTGALALAQSAAYALGRLGPPGAAEALLAALDDVAYPEIVAAAATGLGLLGQACPARAAAKLRDLAHSDEPQIQVAAQHAAALCGH